MKDNFDAKYIKKSIEALDKHLRAMEVVSSTNEDSPKKTLNKTTLWEKVSRFFQS